MACGDVLSLEDLQTAKKHQIFEAEVITGKAGGVAGGANIGTATNPVTGQTQQTLPSILADLGFDVQSWTSSTGGVLASANQVFLNDTAGSLGLGDYYAWGGTFPKTVPAGTDPALPTSGYVMRSSRFASVQAREALRRSYAEAGYNLVDGSFEAGGTLVNTNDVLLQERTGKAFSGPAGTVAAGTDPTSGGFVDRSNALLRNLLGNTGFAFFHVGADPQTKLRNAVSYGNLSGTPISCAGLSDFAITGSDDIVVKTSLDFAGLSVDVSQWTGKFIIQDGDGYESFGPSSSLVQALVASGIQSGAKFTGWDNITVADDSYIKIKTSQPFFTYRGNTLSREEYNKHSRFGMLESPLKYSLDPTTITEILVLKISAKKKTFGGVNFRLGSRDQSGQPTVIRSQYCSLTDIKDVRFSMDNLTYQSGNPVLIDLWDSCHIKLDSVYCQWPMYTTATTGYTYDISVNLCYDVTLERCDGLGDGWGATGNNSSQCVKIRDSKLSRIDFHQPFRELLEISNTKIGDAGIVITALGDLILNDVEFIRANRTKTGYAGTYIATRSDTGGFCDGNLIINGLKANFDSETPHNLLVHFGSVSQPKPAGSPINYRFWDSISVRDVRNDFGGSLGLFPIVQSGVGISLPASITLRDCTSGNFKFAGNVSSFAPSLAPSIDSQVNMVAPVNLNIVLDNVKLLYTDRLSLVDTAANNFRIHASMRKVYGTRGGKSISLQFNFAGVVDMYDCDIESIDFSTGGGVTKYLDVAIQNCELNYQARFVSYIVNGFVIGKTNVKIANSRLALPASYSVQANTLSQCRLVGNTYYNPTDGASEMLRLPLPSSQSVGITAGINPANSYVLEMSGNNKWAPFTLPRLVNEASYIQQSATANATVTRNSTTSLFLAGSTTAPVAVWIA